jgi:hypothetical protein
MYFKIISLKIVYNCFELLSIHIFILHVILLLLLIIISSKYNLSKKHLRQTISNI